MPQRKISHIIMMGDSLSDRGTMNKKFLFGFIPMRWVSGLSTYSPKGRFTNGFAWSDNVVATMISQFTIDELKSSPNPDSASAKDKFENSKNSFGKKRNFNTADDVDDILTHRYNKIDEFKKEKGLDGPDIADYMSYGDKDILSHVRKHYSLTDDMGVRYKNRNFVRNYDEGGLTAHDYSWHPSKSIKRFFTRLILTTLKDKRKELLAYDKEHQLTKKHKKKTLIIEWSGANDLITVNEKPSRKEAEKAVKERIKNAEELIKNGYRNFVLFDQPMLSYTPRYQRKTEEERIEADKWCKHFNEELMKACDELNKKYPKCKIDVFKASEKFDKIYHNPEKYKFKTELLKKPYTESDDFAIKKDGTSPSDGYPFWDDVHFTADMHAIMSTMFYKKYTDKEHYEFTAPKAKHENEENPASVQELCEAFQAKYKEVLEQEKKGFFGLFRRSKLTTKLDMDFDLETSIPKDILKKILRHGLYDNKHNRAKDVMIKLGWIDKYGRLENIPELLKAKNKLAIEMNRGELEAFRKGLPSR